MHFVWSPTYASEKRDGRVLLGYKFQNIKCSSLIHRDFRQCFVHLVKVYQNLAFLDRRENLLQKDGIQIIASYSDVLVPRKATSQNGRPAKVILLDIVKKSATYIRLVNGYIFLKV